jgi:hypothetical protein
MLTFPEIIAQLAALPVPPPARQQEARWRHRASLYCAILAVGINTSKLTTFTCLPLEEIEPALDSLYSNDLLLTGTLSERYVKQYLRDDSIVDQIVGRTARRAVASQTPEPVTASTSPAAPRVGRSSRKGGSKSAIIVQLVLQQCTRFDLAAIRKLYLAAAQDEDKTATAAVGYVIQQLLKQRCIHIVQSRARNKGGAVYEVIGRTA